MFWHCSIVHMGSGEEQRKVSAGWCSMGAGSAWPTLASASQALVPGFWCSHCCVWPAEHLCGQAVAVFEGSSVPGATGRLWVGSLLQKLSPGLCQAPRLRCWALCQARGLLSSPSLETVETTLSF